MSHHTKKMARAFAAVARSKHGLGVGWSIVLRRDLTGKGWLWKLRNGDVVLEQMPKLMSGLWTATIVAPQHLGYVGRGPWEAIEIMRADLSQIVLAVVKARTQVSNLLATRGQ